MFLEAHVTEREHRAGLGGQDKAALHIGGSGRLAVGRLYDDTRQRLALPVGYGARHLPFPALGQDGETEEQREE